MGPASWRPPPGSAPRRPPPDRPVPVGFSTPDTQTLHSSCPCHGSRLSFRSSPSSQSRMPSGKKDQPPPPAKETARETSEGQPPTHSPPGSLSPDERFRAQDTRIEALERSNASLERSNASLAASIQELLATMRTSGTSHGTSDRPPATFVDSADPSPSGGIRDPPSPAMELALRAPQGTADRNPPSSIPDGGTPLPPQRLTSPPTAAQVARYASDAIAHIQRPSACAGRTCRLAWSVPCDFILAHESSVRPRLLRPRPPRPRYQGSLNPRGPQYDAHAAAKVAARHLARPRAPSVPSSGGSAP